MPTRAWNESDPSNTDDASAGAQEIRELKADVRERMSLEHLFGLLVGSTDAGMHVWDYKAKTGSYPLTTSDHFIFATQGITLTLPAIASTNKGKAFAIKVNGTGTVTVAKTGADTIDGAASLSLIGTALGGELAYLISDGVSDWKRYVAYDPRVSFAQSKYIGMKYRNLKITTTGAGNAQSVVLTADRVWLPDSTGVTVIHDTVSQECDLSTAGANGLDTGALAANIGYYIWGISDGSTFAVLASLSATTPSLPAGYTFRELLGWCTTDATGTPFNIEEFTQIDDEYVWAVTPAVASNTGTSNAAAALDLSKTGTSSFDTVPSVAKQVHLKAWAPGGTTDILFSGVTFPDAETSASSPSVNTSHQAIDSAAQSSSFTIVLLEAQTVYWHTTSASGTHVNVRGFSFKR